jgi:pimeloyl-ACP methyl ester carboxylesterase
MCNAFFPKAEHITLDTGHWVQAEKPIEFVKELAKFIES